MAKKGDPKVLRHVVAFLREKARMSQTIFGQKVGLDQSRISDFERGQDAPDEEQLRRMARAASIGWHLVTYLTRCYASILAASDRTSANANPVDDATTDTIWLAMMPYSLDEESEEGATTAELLQEAEEIWLTLEGFRGEEPQKWVETAPPEASRSWAALVRVICEASERAASDCPARALELAELALLLAERVTGDDAAQAGSYAWGYLANARRVAFAFDAADEAFARAWSLRTTEADSELLPRWRLFDLEASLRREQHRFQEALERLDQALARSEGDRFAGGRILLKKANVLEHMGDFEQALAILARAAPLIEIAGDPRQLFALRFNTADNLCRLERYTEAARLLPQVHELVTAEQDNRLNRIRTTWLDAKVKAGLGRKEEAMAGLEAVRDFFTTEELPYEAALASLDLALLWLEAGRLPEVRELSLTMGWIFKSQKIHREALASLALFCEAAEREAATVALTRQVIAEVEEAQRTAPPLRG